MKSIDSVKDVCELMFALEAEHDLLDLEIEGVKLWQYLRMSIYYRIARACGVLDDPQPSTQNPWSKARARASNLRSALLHNPFHRSGPIDALVFDHPRSTWDDGAPVEIYTQALLAELAKKGEQTLVVEAPSRGTHIRVERIRSADPDRTHLDVVHLHDRLARLVGRYAASPDGRREVERLATRVAEALPARLDLRSLLFDGLCRFHSDHAVYSRLIRKLRPRKIYVVVAYDNLGSLIKAAREQGIEVAELQHGVFSRYHLGYSYPDRSEPLDYFPDRFFTWGRYWSDLIEFPIAREKITETGFAHFHRMKRAHRETPRRKNRILVLSQGALGRALATRLHEHIDELEGYEIVYKLHPSEYACWKEYSPLVDLARSSSVRVVDHNADLYELFAEAEYQIGAFSTAIYEGIGMGCRTVLMDLPGVENMDRLLDQGLAVLHRRGDDLASSLLAANSIDSRSGLEEIFGESTDAD